MSLTQNEQGVGRDGTELAEKLSYKGIEINTDNPFTQTDLGIIIKAFEVECAEWGEQDYALAYHYRDVYGTENFSHRVREQMNYYPGMHQQSSNYVPAQDPQYTNAKKMSDDRLNFWNNAMDNPDAFMNGARQRQADFDYTTIFGSETSAKDRAKELGKMLTECVPCFDRLLDPGALLPDADLLEIHALNIKIRTDLLDKIMSLFKDPGPIDICDLLKLLSHLCPQDLLAILALLTQFLAKLNLDVKFNIDFIIQLVGPILSPFLDALSQWLDKWIQMILAPIICVVDHINETIITAQTLEIPFSQVTGNVELDLGIAAPMHQNSDGTFGGGFDTGIGNRNQGVFDPDFQDPYASAWGSWQWQQFETPDKEKYNPTIPKVPREEVDLARQEIGESWGQDFSEVEREERLRRFEELRAEHQEKKIKVPPPLRRERADGTRWSKDDIPNSEKYQTGGSWEGGYHPPERQRKPAEAVTYLDAEPLVNSIVQLRNILQAGVQYVQDWFTYVTQMIYDLLGVEIGWMSKKADNTMLKSRIIQLIMFVKAIIRAISKNGLECGTHSNFNEAQMQYILEQELNKNSEKSGGSKFIVHDDGTIEVLPPGRTVKPTIKDLSDDKKDIEIDNADSDESGAIDTADGTSPDNPVIIPTPDKQKSSESGIIIKNCFRNVGQEELTQVRKWIADFEKRGGA